MTESKPLIAFIDDEESYSMRYVRELLDHFDTHYFDSASEGYAYCSGLPNLKCVVLDVMMPPPDEVDLEEVNDGLETGIWILEKLQSQFVRDRVGVVILSNRNITLVRDAVSKIDMPKRAIEIRTKSDTPSWHLPILVRKVIDRLG